MHKTNNAVYCRIEIIHVSILFFFKRDIIYVLYEKNTVFLEFVCLYSLKINFEKNKKI